MVSKEQEQPDKEAILDEVKKGLPALEGSTSKAQFKTLRTILVEKVVSNHGEEYRDFINEEIDKIWTEKFKYFEGFIYVGFKEADDIKVATANLQKALNQYISSENNPGITPDLLKADEENLIEKFSDLEKFIINWSEVVKNARAAGVDQASINDLKANLDELLSILRRLHDIDKLKAKHSGAGTGSASAGTTGGAGATGSSGTAGSGTPPPGATPGGPPPPSSGGPPPSIPPLEPERENLRDAIRENRLRNFQILSDAGLDQEAFEYLMKEANQAMTDYISSGSGMKADIYGRRFLGVFDALKDFNHKKLNIDSRKRPGDSVKWGDRSVDPSQNIDKREELAQELATKAIELICASNLIDVEVNHSVKESFATDWEAIGRLDHERGDNFGIESYDFFLLEENFDTKETLKYKYSKLFTYIAWELPRIVRRAEKGRPELVRAYLNSNFPAHGIAEKFINKMAGKFEDESKFIEEFSGKTNLNDIQLGKIFKETKIYRGLGLWNERAADEHIERVMEIVAEEIARLKAEANQKGSHRETVKQHENPNGGKRWDSEGDKEFNFIPDDFDKLDTNSVELNHFKTYAKAFATATGVRQHLFVNELARGSTPGGGISKYKDLLIKVSRYALSNYQCYKGAVPHILTEGFVTDWKESTGKRPVIASSIALTEYVLERVMKLRTERVDLGDITGEDHLTPIETTYPDLYAFIVRAQDRRKGKPASLEAFYEGLEALDNFVTAALIVPGGVSDIDRLKEMKPDELLDAMMKDFKDLVQTKMSPLKINQDWVNWRHIAQYVIMFIDRMYRVYKVCDDTPDGRAKLTHEIRQRLVEYSYNLQGVESKAEWIQNGTKPAKEFILGTDQKPRVRGVSLTQRKERWGGYLSGKSEPESIKSENSEEKIKIDIRDWLLSRIPELDNWSIKPGGRLVYGRIIGQEGGPSEDIKTSMSRVKGPVVSSFRTKGAVYLDNIIHNRAKAFTNVWYDFINKGSVPEFEKLIKDVIFGTPAAEQKKVSEEEHK